MKPKPIQYIQKKTKQIQKEEFESYPKKIYGFNKKVMGSLYWLKFLVSILAGLKIIFTNKKDFLDQGFDLIIPSTDFSIRKGTYVNIENRVQLSNNPIEAKSGLDEVWKIISNISVNFDGANLNYSNFEDVFARMCTEIKSFNGLKLESLSKEAILINNS